ncbi:MAG: DUF86 domain-containing protein [Planctomycetes bacterium]|nr:DUF86 domain-containing protein [Planctomycetota bacterium]
MSRDYKVYLEDILEAIGKIRTYTADMSMDSFSADNKTLDAVLRNLEVIGEAAKCIPDEVRSQHEQVEWKKIAGLRDILIHQYFGIDSEIIWDVVRNKLPELERQIRDAVQ